MKATANQQAESVLKQKLIAKIALGKFTSREIYYYNHAIGVMENLAQDRARLLLDTSGGQGAKTDYNDR